MDFPLSSRQFFPVRFADEKRRFFCPHLKLPSAERQEEIILDYMQWLFECNCWMFQWIAENTSSVELKLHCHKKVFSSTAWAVVGISRVFLATTGNWERPTSSFNYAKQRMVKWIHSAATWAVNEICMRLRSIETTNLALAGKFQASLYVDKQT